MKGLQLAMGFLAGISLLATATSGVNLLRRPAPASWDLVLVTGGAGPYWQRLAEGAAAAAHETGARLHVEMLDESNAVDQQELLLQRLATERHDGVAFCPLASSAKPSSANELSQATKVLAYMHDAPPDVLSRVLPGEYSGGKKAADAAADLMRGGGIIVALTTPDTASSERLAGLDDQLRVRNRQFGMMEPAWNLVTISLNESDIDQAARKLGQALGSGLRPACIVSLGDGRLSDVLGVLSRAANNKNAKVIVFDQSREALEAITAGRIAAALVFDPFAMGHEAIAMLARLCRSNEFGLPVRGHGSVQLSPQLVDARNVEQFRSRFFARPALPPS
jgi:ribose transport system substrate-binding protein